MAIRAGIAICKRGVIIPYPFEIIAFFLFFRELNLLPTKRRKDVCFLNFVLLHLRWPWRKLSIISVRLFISACVQFLTNFLNCMGSDRLSTNNLTKLMFLWATLFFALILFGLFSEGTDGIFFKLWWPLGQIWYFFHQSLLIKPLIELGGGTRYTLQITVSF